MDVTYRIESLVTCVVNSVVANSICCYGQSKPSLRFGYSINFTSSHTLTFGLNEFIVGGK